MYAHLEAKARLPDFARFCFPERGETIKNRKKRKQWILTLILPLLFGFCCLVSAEEKKDLDTGGKLELSGEPFPGKNKVRERRFGEYYPLEQKKYETEIQNSEGKQITNEEVWIGNERTCLDHETKEKETGTSLKEYGEEQSGKTGDRISYTELLLLWVVSGTCLLALAWKQKRGQK